MNSLPNRSAIPARHLPHDVPSLVAMGKRVLQLEADALLALTERIDESFAAAVELVLGCQGTVVVSGMGKAGLVARKLVASFSSTGTPACFLHPAEAVHGDLGCIRSIDLVVLFSNSGETEEIVRLLPTIKEMSVATLAITATTRSTLAAAVDVVLPLGSPPEACTLGLAPSCTTTAMMAMGDALALVTSQQRGFTREQFAKLHPAGSLGRKLTKVQDVMRPIGECRVASQNLTVREVLIHAGRPGRRTGAIMLVNSQGILVGIFTDSDLARLLETSHETCLDQRVSQVMTRNFQTVVSDSLLPEALQLLAERKISELPVVTPGQQPLGIIDITDVMSVLAKPWQEDDQRSTVKPKIYSYAEFQQAQPKSR